MIVWKLDLQLPVQSVPICCEIVVRCTPVSSNNKTDCHNIAEILLKVELSAINQTNLLIFMSSELKGHVIYCHLSSGLKGHVIYCHHFASVVVDIHLPVHISNFFSEITGPIRTKLGKLVTFGNST